MMSDIFSIFDPAKFSLLIPSSSMTVMLNMVPIMMMQSQMWKPMNRKLSTYSPMMNTMMMQLSRTMSTNLKGISSMVTSLFIMIIMINLMGLIPYSLSTSSHLIFTLSMGLPMWISMIMSSMMWSPKKSIAHFLPDGAPEWLNPFLVMIETTSVLVRPITLSFRLAANMTAGHIVLTLMSLYCASAMFSSMNSFVVLMIISSGYIAFELAICLIQAYIFCLLLSLYSDDHAH